MCAIRKNVYVHRKKRTGLFTVNQTLGWVAVFYPQDLTVGQNSGDGYPEMIIQPIGHPSLYC